MELCSLEKLISSLKLVYWLSIYSSRSRLQRNNMNQKGVCSSTCLTCADLKIRLNLKPYNVSAEWFPQSTNLQLLFLPRLELYAIGFLSRHLNSLFNQQSSRSSSCYVHIESPYFSLLHLHAVSVACIFIAYLVMYAVRPRKYAQTTCQLYSTDFLDPNTVSFNSVYSLVPLLQSSFLTRHFIFVRQIVSQTLLSRHVFFTAATFHVRLK